MTEACCECRYWHDTGWGDELGMCRRYPPTVPCMEGGIIEEHGIMVTDHPLVLLDGWCGEWKEVSHERMQEDIQDANPPHIWHKVS